MAFLAAQPTMKSLAFYNHYHVLVSELDGVWDHLEFFPFKAYEEGVITVHHSNSSS